MTTRKYGIGLLHYDRMLYELQCNKNFTPTEWAIDRAQLERDIMADVDDIIGELQIGPIVSEDWKEGFIRLNRDDVQERFLDMQFTETETQIIKDFSYYITQVGKLVQLQGYLRDLKQLD